MSGLYLFARIAGMSVAIRTDEIEAVVRLQELSPVPGVPGHVAGLSALRSRVLTILDAAAQITGHVTSEADGGSVERYAIVCGISGHSYGILVDGVDDIRTVSASPTPVYGKISPEWQPYASGVIEDEGKPYFIVRLTSFLDNNMAVQAA